jgi:hypothetical protein
MPYPNYHSARISDPAQYDTHAYSKGKFGKGIDAVFGIKDGKSSLQAIRFDKTRWSSKQARKWLSKHGHKPLAFEQARQDEVAKSRAVVWQLAKSRAAERYGKAVSMRQIFELYDELVSEENYYREKYGGDNTTALNTDE